MAAYVLVQVSVTKPEQYETYKPLAAAAVQQYGGKYIVRGGTASDLEGSRPYPRIVMIEFPSAMNACLAVVEMPLSPRPGQSSALPSLRVGIDFGEVVEENGDLFGDPVNVAAHICKRANPGGIAEQSVKRFEMIADC